VCVCQSFANDSSSSRFPCFAVAASWHSGGPRSCGWSIVSRAPHPGRRCRGYGTSQDIHVTSKPPSDLSPVQVEEVLAAIMKKRKMPPPTRNTPEARWRWCLTMASWPRKRRRLSSHTPREAREGTASNSDLSQSKCCKERAWCPVLVQAGEWGLDLVVNANSVLKIVKLNQLL